jgi:hypothetical protein
MLALLYVALGTRLLLRFFWIDALLLGTALCLHTLLSYPAVKAMDLLNRQPVVPTIGGALIADTLARVLLAILIQTARNVDGGSWNGFCGCFCSASLFCSRWCLPRAARAMFVQSGVSRPEKVMLALVVLRAGLCDPTDRHRVDHGRVFCVTIDTGMRIELDILTGQLHVWAMAGPCLPRCWWVDRLRPGSRAGSTDTLAENVYS